MAEPIQIPAIPLWSKWPRDKLAMKQIADPRAFARGYQMRSYSDEELLFPSFQKCREHAVQLGNIVRAGWPMFTGVDLSSDKRPGTVIFTMALEPGTFRRYPINVRIGAWTSPQTVSQLTEVLNAYPSIQTILVENNAYQQALIDWIMTVKAGRLWLKVESFTTTGHNKANAEIGLPSLEAEFSKRMWVVPHNEYEHHPPTCLCGWCRWDRQMTNYPHVPETDAVMACVTPGALVTTVRGAVSIEDVAVGDVVLTHLGNWRSVTRTMVRQHDGGAVLLKAGGRMPFIVTPEHPVWTSSPKFLRDGTNRLVPTTWSFRPSGELRSGRKLAGDFAFLPAAPAPAQDAVLNIGGVDIPVDEDLAGVLGLWLAEGNVSGAPHQVQWALNAATEGYIADWVQRVMASLGRNATRHSTDNSMRVTCSWAPFARTMEQLGKHAEKGPPAAWLGWPLRLRLAVARGWLVGDGHLYHGRLVGTSISRHILHFMDATLREAGLAPTWRRHNTGGTYKINGKTGKNSPCWQLLLSERDTQELLAAPTSVERERWGTLGQPRERTNGIAVRTHGGHAAKIAKLETVRYSGPVYNLHVEGDESYVVEGVAVHNCWFAREAVNRYLGIAGAAQAATGNFNDR